MSFRINKLLNLTNESPESYYWLGFLLADAHFSNKNRLVISLSRKDKDHLFKFLFFLNCNSKIKDHSFKWHNKKYEMSTLSIMDNNALALIKEKYNIKSNKTKNPPNLNSISDENKFCVMIGFIDGDGSIQYQTGRKDCIISVKCHSSWLDNLELMFGNSKINSQGYAYHCTSDNEILREWKRKAINLNLPIMERKWDKIDTSKISRYAIAKNWQKEAIDLFNSGKSVKEISNILNKKYTTVYAAFVRKQLIRKEV